jgi:hypothetical protein
MKKASEWASEFGVDTKYDDSREGEAYMSIDGRCVEKIQLDAYQQALADIYFLINFTKDAAIEMEAMGLPVKEAIHCLKAVLVTVKDYSTKCDPINKPIDGAKIKVVKLYDNKPDSSNSNN